MAFQTTVMLVAYVEKLMITIVTTINNTRFKRKTFVTYNLLGSYYLYIATVMYRETEICGYAE